MRTRITLAASVVAFLLALVPAQAAAQFNGCYVCYEADYFHWVAEPPVPVFEGPYRGHGIMHGGCDSHTHLEICCICGGLTDAQEGLLRQLVEHPETLGAEAAEQLARYFMREDPARFAFLDPGAHPTPERRFAFKGCDGVWVTRVLT